jgi:hypothetical protein
MVIQLCLLNFALPELFAQVAESGHLTLADRYGLLAALLKVDSLTEEERSVIDRILYATNRGRVQIVDEISALPFQA